MKAAMPGQRTVSRIGLVPIRHRPGKECFETLLLKESELGAQALVIFVQQGGCYVCASLDPDL
jgi:hypothetical protein